MKGQLKNKLWGCQERAIFQIIETQGKRVTLFIGDKKVDFGFSEVKIVAKTESDLIDLGAELLRMGKKSIAGWREKDVTNFIAQLDLPIAKNLARKAINKCIWLI